MPALALFAYYVRLNARGIVYVLTVERIRRREEEKKKLFKASRHIVEREKKARESMWHIHM